MPIVQYVPFSYVPHLKPASFYVTGLNAQTFSLRSFMLSHFLPTLLANTMTSNEEEPTVYRVNRSDNPFDYYDRNGFDYRLTSSLRLESHPDDALIVPHKIEMLPATAEAYFEEELLEKFGWEGAVKTILTGTRDKNSTLNKLRDHETTLTREIYSYLATQWARHVKLTIPAALVGQCGQNTRIRFNHGRRNHNWGNRDILDSVSSTSHGFDDGFVAFARCGIVDFPEPAERNVNMMPFIFGNKESLPDDLQCYYPMIQQCPYMADDVGKVGFLTVHESYISSGSAQRREGLHIESPGIFCDDPNAAAFTPGREHPWGMGIFWGPDRYEGGIFMASSVANTSEV